MASQNPFFETFASRMQSSEISPTSPGPPPSAEHFPLQFSSWSLSGPLYVSHSAYCSYLQIGVSDHPVSYFICPACDHRRLAGTWDAASSYPVEAQINPVPQVEREEPTRSPALARQPRPNLRVEIPPNPAQELPWASFQSPVQQNSVVPSSPSSPALPSPQASHGEVSMDESDDALSQAEPFPEIDPEFEDSVGVLADLYQSPEKSSQREVATEENEVSQDGSSPELEIEFRNSFAALAELASPGPSPEPSTPGSSLSEDSAWTPRTLEREYNNYFSALPDPSQSPEESSQGEVANGATDGSEEYHSQDIESPRPLEIQERNHFSALGDHFQLILYYNAH